ncbi:MAG: hypothetical protein BGN98_10360 [Microbacterium sp. 69-7]|nr:MAG: hypothetical protein BGN98_10360 [Microbacterium sp. 69-7]
MLPTEAAALGMAIEEMEKPAAMERMLAGKAPCATGGTGSEEGYRSRDIAAEAVGMSTATYTRLKTLITTAADVRAGVYVSVCVASQAATTSGFHRRYLPTLNACGPWTGRIVRHR